MPRASIVTVASAGGRTWVTRSVGVPMNTSVPMAAPRLAIQTEPSRAPVNASPAQRRIGLPRRRRDRPRRAGWGRSLGSGRRHLDHDGIAALLRRHLDALEPAAEGGRIAFGRSTARDAATLTAALEQARHAARLASAQPARLAMITTADLDSHRLLLADVPADVRGAFRDRLLGPLHAYDAEHRSELAHALRIFLDANGSRRATAQELHIHVSTLHYRIGRIEALTGRDLGTARDRVDLYLACTIDEI
ncbi:helix-turn-helix domain-containing protein [Nocardia sp. NEAU-G5]|uniref:Helix-turn-helix domain-containing protein n=1 Tax=Nocardia albiluteola TaxID=2842303 RepID=A0ABS6BBB8_9NOCA|nr:helix-turn-helix domain-containing protein [Nocardia albiluteola]MBU3067582.1 helix-turn-helix domain-containing protein [Nocardia albiluteola]